MSERRDWRQAGVGAGTTTTGGCGQRDMGPLQGTGQATRGAWGQDRVLGVVWWCACGRGGAREGERAARQAGSSTGVMSKPRPRPRSQPHRFRTVYEWSGQLGTRGTSGDFGPDQRKVPAFTSSIFHPCCWLLLGYGWTCGSVELWDLWDWMATTSPGYFLAWGMGARTTAIPPAQGSLGP